MTDSPWSILSKFDVSAQVDFLDLVKNHPVGNIHKFIGFDGVREIEEEYLPVAKLSAKYDQSLGYLPVGSEFQGD